MLDTTTKKRIDDCRDILVGKLPDPKAQIEQITIGLIYKFMDDMDQEAVDLGGTAKFFSGEYEKYSWANLFDSRVTANNMLTLYSEAIMSMDKNPNIPQLFRDIFKNAYLPYRDPETLKMFLKTIGEFEYTHSEKLGDAFEYLLSVMGSQGDAGQFRTPRHIIDFLVAVVNPGKSDTILDPACGTAGFLISAFKHIREKNNHDLTPDERKRMIRNVTGYDISPDMVRLSLVNLYLHGFSDPRIYEYDTLSSEERWNENYDVILANPPFMSPKGGIRPHKKFSISSNRSEVLFVDYIAEHLNPKGRAGIIVPEGIIFQSGTAYKELRKMLIENHLYAVVSLPAGVFNPYSGVKTSILLLDRELVKTIDDILFVKIENDGFSLGAQRTQVKGGQLEEAIGIVKQFREHSFVESLLAHTVKKSEIAKNGDWNLSGERYKNQIQFGLTDFKLVEIGEIMEFQYGKPLKTENRKEGNYPVFGSNGIVGWHDEFIVSPPFIVVGRKGSAGALHYSENPGYPIDTTFFIENGNPEILDLKYAFHVLKTLKLEKVNVQAGVPGLNRNDAYKLQIPLPPLPIQQEIIAEIEGYQKIIDGAKMVVESYKPKIEIDPAWEMVELGEVCTQITDGSHFSPETTDEGYPYVTVRDLTDGVIDFANCKKIERKYYLDLLKSGCNPKVNDILFSKDGTVGKTALVKIDKEFVVLSSLAIISPDLLKVNEKYLYYMMSTKFFINKAIDNKTGVAIKRIVLKTLKTIQIPIPPKEIQNQIVSRIEEEQNLVNANKRLITIFEQKIKERIARVWGE